MTTREQVTICNYDSEITATVVLEDGEATHFEDIVLHTSSTKDIDLGEDELLKSTVSDLYEAAERQHRSYLEADEN